MGASNNVSYTYLNLSFAINGAVQITELGFLIELRKSGPPAFMPNEFVIGIVEIEFQSDSRLRVKIHPNAPRHEV